MQSWYAVTVCGKKRLSRDDFNEVLSPYSEYIKDLKNIRVEKKTRRLANVESYVANEDPLPKWVQETISPNYVRSLHGKVKSYKHLRTQLAALENDFFFKDHRAHSRIRTLVERFDWALTSLEMDLARINSIVEYIRAQPELAFAKPKKKVRQPLGEVYLWKLVGADVQNLPSGCSIWKIGISNGESQKRAKSVVRLLDAGYSNLTVGTSHVASDIETYLHMKFDLSPRVSRLFQGWTELRILSDAEAEICRQVILSPPDNLKQRIARFRKHFEKLDDLEEDLETLEQNPEWISGGRLRSVKARIEKLPELMIPRGYAKTTIVVPAKNGTRALPKHWSGERNFGGGRGALITGYPWALVRDKKREILKAEGIFGLHRPYEQPFDLPLSTKPNDQVEVSEEVSSSDKMDSANSDNSTEPTPSQELPMDESLNPGNKNAIKPLRMRVPQKGSVLSYLVGRLWG